MERRQHLHEVVLLAVVLTLVLAVAGCAEDDPGADGDVESLGALVPSPVADELTESGRCDDGLLWAADEAGTVVVTVELAGGAGDEVVLPSTDVEVVVLHGERLADDLCSDEGAPASTSPGVQGRVELERDEQGCVAGFRVDGLEADDGTTFGPIEGTVPAAACAPG